MFRRMVVALAGGALLIGACTSITIPSIPPIPTVPPGFTIPPIALPSGVALPTGDPNSPVCALVTTEEMTAIMGAQVSVTASEPGECTYTLPSFAAIIVSISSDTDMSGPTFLFGDSAQNLTIGGFPAISGVAIGQPAVYVQKPASQLSVLGILTGNDQATIDKLVQVATTAVARMP